MQALLVCRVLIRSVTGLTSRLTNNHENITDITADTAKTREKATYSPNFDRKETGRD